MNYLLDVNVLVALGWEDHDHYQKAARWIARAMADGHHMLTSAIPQMGFVRVSILRLGGQLTPGDAGKRLENLITAFGEAHRFIPDDETSFHWPAWCHNASRTTDAHLLALAEKHRARLATLDTSIPGAFVIP